MVLWWVGFGVFLVLTVISHSVWELALFSQPDNTAISVLTWCSYHLSLFSPLPPVMNCHVMFCHFSAVQSSGSNISTHLRTLEIKEKFI